MNERIRAIWETNDSIPVVWPETGSPVSVSATTLTKFAQLIVEKCIAQIREVDEDYFKARLEVLNFTEKNRLNTGERACHQSIQKIENFFAVDKYDY